MEEIRAIIKATHHSAPGPDGLPFEAYKILIDTSAPILVEVLAALFNDSRDPPTWFNRAWLVLLGKKATMTKGGTEAYTPKNMRPLSIVGCFNRRSNPYACSW